MRKRNVEVQFRLSEAEYAELVQKVKDSGLNRNAFLVRQTFFVGENAVKCGCKVKKMRLIVVK